MANGTIDYLKEYLISLGWKIDTNSLKFATDKTNAFINGVKSKVGEMGAAYIDAGIAGIHAIAKLSEASIKLLNITAEADKQTEKLAKKYFTTEKNARAFFGSLKSMNLNYSDLFWTTEEERSQFQELYSFSKSLEVPDEVENTLKTVREFNLEFKKLQALIQYGSRAIAYYIGQYAGSEIEYWLEQLKSLVILARENLPKIANIIGRIASVVITFISAIGKGLIRIYSLIKPIFEFIIGAPNAIKLLGGIITFFLLSPLGKVITALSLIMLLVEDFMYWKAGKHSAIDWSGFVGVFDNIENNINNLKLLIDEFKEKFSPIKDDFDAVKEKIKSVKDYFFSEDFKNSWLYKLINWTHDKLTKITEFLGFTDDKQVIHLANPQKGNEDAARSIGVRSAGGHRVVTTNITSNDTYNLTSSEEGISTFRRNVENIKRQMNNYYSKSFE